MKKFITLFFALVLALTLLAACDNSANEANSNTTNSGSSQTSEANNAKTYKEGQYKVGTDIPAGEYVLIVKSTTKGYYCISTDANGKDIVANSNFDGNSIVSIEDGQYLQITRCEATPFDEADNFAEGKDVLTDGLYKIGFHLKAGEYKVSATSASAKGYYCISSDANSRSIIANKNFDGDTYVTVEDGQYLNLTRCSLAVK